MISPKGQRFEIQFNTKHNIDVKEKMHKIYEKDRIEKDPKQKQIYKAEMMKIAKEFEPIKGINKFVMENV